MDAVLLLSVTVGVESEQPADVDVGEIIVRPTAQS
jgi:hypothetical protein